MIINTSRKSLIKTNVLAGISLFILLMLFGCFATEVCGTTLGWIMISFGVAALPIAGIVLASMGTVILFALIKDVTFLVKRGLNKQNRF